MNRRHLIARTTAIAAAGLLGAGHAFAQLVRDFVQ